MHNDRLCRPRYLFRLVLLLLLGYGGWPQAASAQEAQCQNLIQGRIAWDYQGSTGWASGNLQRLCAGTRAAAEPGACFNRAMHGGVNWGGGTQWAWENALALCAGTSDANATISCFQNQIAQGVAWQNAIPNCRGAGQSAGQSAGPTRRSVEAGPIWNQADANQKCPALAARMGGRWTGGWRTTVEGQMSVCEIETGSGGQAQARQPTNYRYYVEVKTGNVSGAGTDADVRFYLRGSLGETNLLIDPPGDSFEAGSLDGTSFTVADRGELQAIALANEGGGPGPDWYVEYVCVGTRPNPCASGGAVFYVNMWLESGTSTGWINR